MDNDNWLSEQMLKLTKYEEALKEIANLPTINRQLVDAQYIALIALKDKDI